MRTKICGITRLEDALETCNQGAWAIGFNFCRQSPRFITKDGAKKIIGQLPETIKKVGIFVEENSAEIERYMDQLGLDLAQVYTPFSAGKLLKQRMIYSLVINNRNELPPILELASYGYLLIDAPHEKNSLLGGTGRLCDWNLARELAKDFKLILSGGLTPENVEAAIQAVNPYAVDVATGVERRPGIKDSTAMKKFLMATSSQGLLNDRDFLRARQVVLSSNKYFSKEVGDHVK